MLSFLTTLLIIFIIELLIVVALFRPAYNFLYKEKVTYTLGLVKSLAFIYKNFKEALWIPIIIVIFVDIIIATIIQLFLFVFL